MADVTVRGAGIFGLSIAWRLVQRGASVKVIDPAGPGAGSSGGVVGALAPHVPENWNTKKAFQLESLLMAEPFWKEVAEISGYDPGYRRSGRVQPIADAKALHLAQERGENTRSLWPDHVTWRVEPLPGGPWAPPSPTGMIIRDTLSALVHPRLACRALVAALATKGVEIAGSGDDSGLVVWATGVDGLETLNQSHAREVGNGIKGQAAVLAHDAGDAPQLFLDGLHIIPHANGTVALGSTSERDFADAKEIDAQLDVLIEKARTAVPALRGAEVIERWAGVRPRARSRAPMLGPWPERPGHFIANGGFKIGFGMAPKVADVMGRLLIDGENLIPEGFEVSASF